MIYQKLQLNMLQLNFYKKNLRVDQNLLCFVSLYLPRPCLVLVAYNKINIHAFFCLISKLFTLGNMIFNLIPSGELFLILSKKAWSTFSLATTLACSINLFYAHLPFLEILKLSEKLWFSDVSGGIEMEHWLNQITNNISIQ